MKPECKDIVEVVLPAVRASVAEVMSDRYGYKQKERAEKLGVVQVAVSKYLNGKCSREISGMKERIIRQGLNVGVVESIVSGRKRQEIEGEIDKLCDQIVALSVAK
jgi:predicted transcriptional regulator